MKTKSKVRFNIKRPMVKSTKPNDHKINLLDGIRAGITSPESFMASLNGRILLLDHQPFTSVFTDSCNGAAGGTFEGDRFYIKVYDKISGGHFFYSAPAESTNDK